MRPASAATVLAAVIVWCLFARALPLRAQTRAAAVDVTGAVADATGGALAGATVIFTRSATGAVREATTGPDGRLALPGLPVGPYHVRASAPGFAGRELDVTLSLGSSPPLAIVLDIAGVTAEVTVMPRASAIDVAQTDTGVVIDQQQIARLPINGRNFIDFATLTPGAAPDRGSAFVYGQIGRASCRERV